MNYDNGKVKSPMELLLSGYHLVAQKEVNLFRKILEKYTLKELDALYKVQSNRLRDSSYAREFKKVRAIKIIESRQKNTLSLD
jgi:hypothetical protein